MDDDQVQASTPPPPTETPDFEDSTTPGVPSISLSEAQDVVPQVSEDALEQESPDATASDSPVENVKDEDEVADLDGEQTMETVSLADDETSSPPPIPPKLYIQPVDAEEPPPPPPPNPVAEPQQRATNGARNLVVAPNASADGSTGHRRSMTISRANNVSVVLITSALEVIAASKEAKRSAPLRESTQQALELIRANQAFDHPREVFEPLRLACETRNEKLMIASLDCISKLVSYSFFKGEDSLAFHSMPSPPPSPHPGRVPAANANGSQTSIPQPSIVDLVAHTITACHSETTPDTVSLQIVKALLSLVLSPTILVHHSSLLKAVRTVYNIFLLSPDSVNQMVAQGGLTQMVHHVFTRCRQVSSEPGSSHVDLSGLASPRSTSGGLFPESRTSVDSVATIHAPNPILAAGRLSAELPLPPPPQKYIDSRPGSAQPTLVLIFASISFY